MIARSYCCRLYHGDFSLLDNTTLIYRMAYAIHCDRKGIPRMDNPIAYLPWWIVDLEEAKDFGANNTGLPLSKYIWKKRGETYRAAEIYSHNFEVKDG